MHALQALMPAADVQEHERVVAGIPAAAKPLLKPHLEDLDAKLKPGAFVLTWVSLNIDGYLHNLHQVCIRIVQARCESLSSLSLPG